MKNITHAMKSIGDRRDMGGIGAERETQRIILLRLTSAASLNPDAYFPSDDDTKCRYCGIRKRSGNLCGDCESRRVRLAAIFPDVPPPIQAIRKPRREAVCASLNFHAE